MKAIMISIKPRHLAKILNGEKTLEIRKTFPKCDLPIDVYIYCTKELPLYKSWVRCGYFTERSSADDLSYQGSGKVVAKFTLNEIKDVFAIHFPFEYYYKATDLTKMELEKMSCLGQGSLDQYLRKKKGYAWKIDNLEIFNEPKELKQFHKFGYNDYLVYTQDEEMTHLFYRMKKPPQSWCYIEI